MIAPDLSIEGVFVGHTTGRKPMPLVANFNAHQDPAAGMVNGELGKDTQTGVLQDGAVLSNACGDDD